MIYIKLVFLQRKWFCYYEKMKKIKYSTAIWDYVGVCIATFLIVFLLIFASLNLSIFDPFQKAMEDFKMTDLFFHLMHDEDEMELNNDIILIDVTEATSRDVIAKTIQDIGSCSPKVIMIDLIFERPKASIADDVALVDAVLANKDKLIFSTKLTGYNEGPPGHFTGAVMSFFSDVDDFTWAYSNVEQIRPGGCIRMYSLSQRFNDSLIYSMPYMAACRYTGEKVTKKDDIQRLIDFSDTDFLSIPYNKVLEHKNLLKDKLIIVGTMTEEADMHITPLGKMAGMKIQAYSTLTYIHHKEIRVMSRLTSFIMAVFVCFFCAWMGQKIEDRHKFFTSYVLKLFYLMVASALVWIAFLSFVYLDYNINLLYSLLGMALVEEGRLQYSYFIKILGMRTKWKFVKKSIYYE